MDVERMALIARVGQRIAARLDPGELFATTCTELNIRLGYQHVTIFMLDPADPSMLVKRATASRWPGHPLGHRLPISIGLLGVAARECSPVLVNDVAADPRYVPMPGASELRAELAMPIRLGDRLLGVLDVASTRRFADEDVDGLRIVADQLAVALLNAQLFADTQRALDTTRQLYETSRRTSSAMTIAEVVGAFLEEVAARGRYSCMVLLDVRDTDGRRAGLVSAGSYSPQQGTCGQSEPLPQSSAEVELLLDAGETVIIEDSYDEERFHGAEIPSSLPGRPERRLAERLNSAALALIPLLVYGERIGALAVGRPVGDRSAFALEPYLAVAPQLASAIDSRRQQLLRAERERQLAVLDERRRLARELHDSVTQSLFSLHLMSQALPDLWELDHAEAHKALSGIRELAGSALGEMRGLLYELRPGEARPVALVGALGEAASAFERRAGFPVELRLSALEEPPAAVAHAILRIAQEALGNAARHSGARHVVLELTGDPLRLTVADDGNGFAPCIGGDGLGLRGMRERAAAIGAQLTITSAPGQGTSIVALWSD